MNLFFEKSAQVVSGGRIGTIFCCFFVSLGSTGFKRDDMNEQFFSKFSRNSQVRDQPSPASAVDGESALPNIFIDDVHSQNQVAPRPEWGTWVRIHHIDVPQACCTGQRHEFHPCPFQTTQKRQRCEKKVRT
jgi:hypothetical protein